MISTVLIIGGGQAGAQAIDTLRREGFAGRIVLVSEEPELPYQRGIPPQLDYARTGQARSSKRTTRRARRHDFARRHSLARQYRGNESSTASGRGQGQSWP